MSDQNQPQPVISKRKINLYLREQKFVEVVGAYIQTAIINGHWHTGFSLMPKLTQKWLKDVGIDPFTLKYKDLAFSYHMGGRWANETAQKIASLIPYADDWRDQINEIASKLEEHSSR